LSTKLYDDLEPEAEKRAAEKSVARDVEGIRWGEKCPVCGSSAYYPDGGCHTCRACGYSPCK
jgi:uncharacterized OB-fold protein